MDQSKIKWQPLVNILMPSGSLYDISMLIRINSIHTITTTV